MQLSVRNSQSQIPHTKRLQPAEVTRSANGKITNPKLVWVQNLGD
jgi:hypothetical protein